MSLDTLAPLSIVGAALGLSPVRREFSARHIAAMTANTQESSP